MLGVVGVSIRGHISKFRRHFMCRPGNPLVHVLKGDSGKKKGTGYVT